MDHAHYAGTATGTPEISPAIHGQMETCLDAAIYNYRSTVTAAALRYSLRYARHAPRKGKPWKQLVASLLVSRCPHHPAMQALCR